MSGSHVKNPAYVINLNHRTDRMKNALRLESLGLRLIREPAVNGSALDISNLPLHPLVRVTLTTGKRFSKVHFNTLSELGAFLSHRNLWKRISEASTPCVVFEDDAEATKDAATWLRASLEAVTNGTYEMVIMGSHRGTFQPRLVSYPNWLKTGIPETGFWAYVLSPSGARKLLQGSQQYELQSEYLLPTILDRIGFVQCFQQSFFWKGPDCKHLALEDLDMKVVGVSAALGSICTLALVYILWKTKRIE